MDSLFFPYACDACGTPFCERVNLMNVALGLTEQGYCLPCLAAQYQRTPSVMAEFCWQYVKARECFLDPWQQIEAHQCPRHQRVEPDALGCSCQFSMA
ncbi:MAG: hypothetical protein U0003_04805 [Vampirovibrionales bacterium]